MRVEQIKMYSHIGSAVSQSDLTLQTVERHLVNLLLPTPLSAGDASWRAVASSSFNTAPPRSLYRGFLIVDNSQRNS